MKSIDNYSESECSPTKKQRIEDSKQSDCQNAIIGNKRNKTTNLYCKILCQKDYLRLICLYMKIKHIFKAIPLVSKYHNNFLNDEQQEKLIQTCVEYDDYKSAFISFGIEKFTNDQTADNNLSTVSKKLSMIYGISTWEDLVSVVTKSHTFSEEVKNWRHKNIGNYDLRYLLLLKNTAMVKYILPKVECILHTKKNNLLSNQFTK